MKLDVGALVNEPSVSADTEIEVNFEQIKQNFKDLLNEIFDKQEAKRDDQEIFLSSFTYLN